MIQIVKIIMKKVTIIINQTKFYSFSFFHLQIMNNMNLHDKYNIIYPFFILFPLSPHRLLIKLMNFCFCFALVRQACTTTISFYSIINPPFQYTFLYALYLNYYCIYIYIPRFKLYTFQYLFFLK